MDPSSPLIPVGLGTAAGISLAFAALAAFLGRKGTEATGPRWGSALGVGLGYVVAHAILREWLARDRLIEAREALRHWMAHGGAFPLFAGDVGDWLPWLVAGATLLGLLDGEAPAPAWAKWQNWCLLTGLTLWLLLAPLFAGTWETREGLAWVVGLGLAMLIFWRVLDLKSERLGPSMPLVLMLMAAAAGAALAASGTLVFGAPAAALAAAMGGVWVVSWASPRLTLERAAIPPFVVAYCGLLICGTFYGELPRPSAIALVLAPLATLVDWVGPVSRFSRSRKGVARIALLLVPLGIAIYVAVSRRPPDAPLGQF